MSDHFNQVNPSWKREGTFFFTVMELILMNKPHCMEDSQLKQDALASYQAGDEVKALKEAEKYLEHHPSDEEMILLKVRVLQNPNIRGYLDENDRQMNPLDLLEEVLKRNPRSALAWNEKGLLLSRSGRLEEALSCYDNALELDSNLDEILYNKALCLGEMALHEEVVEVFEKYLEKNPKDAEAYFQKALAHAHLGQSEKTLKALKEAFRLSEPSDLYQMMASKHPAFLELQGNKEFQNLICSK